MGIHCDTSISSGPRHVVKRIFRQHVDEYRANRGMSDASDDSEANEEDAAHEATMEAWNAARPSSITDSRALLRPHASACRNWDEAVNRCGVGRCYFGDGCHFRHETDAVHRPEYKQWEAQRPAGTELVAGPTGYFKLSVHTDQLTDALYNEMYCDRVIRDALGLGGDGPDGEDFDLPFGVKRLSTGEGCDAECWWRVPNPSALLGSGSQAVPRPTDELLESAEKEMRRALDRLSSGLTFDHPNTPHAYRVQGHENFLRNAKSSLQNAIEYLQRLRGASGIYLTSLASSSSSSSSLSHHPRHPIYHHIYVAIWAVHALLSHEQGLIEKAEPGNRWDSDDTDDSDDDDEEDEDDDEDEDEDEDVRAERRIGRKMDRMARLRREEDEPYRQLDPAFDRYEKVVQVYESYDHFEQTRTNRQEALRCKEGDRHKRRRGDWSNYDDANGFGSRCKCAEATFRAAIDAYDICMTLAAALKMPKYEFSTEQLKALPEAATDDELLNAAAGDAHKSSLRAFLRHAASKGHEVLISHSVG